MYCSKCGKELADGAKFCPQCGTRINTVPSSTSNISSQSDARSATNAAVENASKFMADMLDKGAKNAKVLAEKTAQASKEFAAQAKVVSEQAMAVANEVKEEATKKINEAQAARANAAASIGNGESDTSIADIQSEETVAQSWSAKNYRLWSTLFMKIPSVGTGLQRIFHPLPNMVRYGCAWFCTAWVTIILVAGVVANFSDGDNNGSTNAENGVPPSEVATEAPSQSAPQNNNAPKFKECTLCNGTGVCAVCKGTGKQILNMAGARVEQGCPNCMGSLCCPMCNGHGRYQTR